MPTIRALPMSGSAHAVPYEEDPFVSLEATPTLLADIRAALPQLEKALIKRWPFINSVQIENRRITRRRNPHDPSQIYTNAVLGIAIYICTRPVRIFLDEIAREAAKKVGPEVGDQILKIAAYAKNWLKRKAHGTTNRRRAMQNRRRVKSRR